MRGGVLFTAAVLPPLHTTPVSSKLVKRDAFCSSPLTLSLMLYVCYHIIHSWNLGNEKCMFAIKSSFESINRICACILQYSLGDFFFGWIMRDWMEKELCSMMHIILLTLYYYPTSSSIKMYVMKLALQCFCKPSTFIFAFCSIFNGYYYYDFFQ